MNHNGASEVQSEIVDNNNNEANTTNKPDCMNYNDA